MLRVSNQFKVSLHMSRITQWSISRSDVGLLVNYGSFVFLKIPQKCVKYLC